MFSRTAYSTVNKGELTLSAGFAKVSIYLANFTELYIKDKLESRNRELFEKGLTISQRATNSQSFYDKSKFKMSFSK